VMRSPAHWIAMRDPARRAHELSTRLLPRSSAYDVASALAGQPSGHHRPCTASTGEAAKRGPTAKVATGLGWSPTPALDTVRPDSSCALSGVGLAAQKAAWQVAPALFLEHCGPHDPHWPAAQARRTARRPAAPRPARRDHRGIKRRLFKGRPWMLRFAVRPPAQPRGAAREQGALMSARGLLVQSLPAVCSGRSARGLAHRPTCLMRALPTAGETGSAFGAKHVAPGAPMPGP